MPLNNPSNLVIVGKVGAPYGVKGWNHIQSFTQPLENLLKYRPWFIKRHSSWQQVNIEAGRRHGEGLVAKFEESDDRDKAAQMTLCDIAIERNQMATLSENEFYWADLEGLEVKLASGESRGHIRYLYENVGTDVMVIDYQGKEYHVPFLFNDTVLKVDKELKCVVVDWDVV